MQHGARDLDHLLFSRTEQADLGGRVYVELQRLQKLLCRDVDTAQPIEKFLLTEK